MTHTRNTRRAHTERMTHTIQAGSRDTSEDEDEDEHLNENKRRAREDETRRDEIPTRISRITKAQNTKQVLSKADK